MEYVLVKRDKGSQPINIINLDENFEILIKKLNPFSFKFKGLIANIYWWLISKKSWIIYVREKGSKKIASFSYVLGKSYKFPFMEKGELQIGPSFTYPEFRRKGLFKSSVQFILKKFEADGFEMIGIARPENLSSLNCLYGLGFIKKSKCWKNKAKIYSLVKDE